MTVCGQEAVRDVSFISGGALVDRVSDQLKQEKKFTNLTFIFIAFLYLITLARFIIKHIH